MILPRIQRYVGAQRLPRLFLWLVFLIATLSLLVVQRDIQSLSYVLVTLSCILRLFLPEKPDRIASWMAVSVVHTAIALVIALSAAIGTLVLSRMIGLTDLEFIAVAAGLLFLWSVSSLTISAVSQWRRSVRIPLYRQGERERPI